ncbi:MAG: class I SAM-dependent methyltransferase [Acidobacteriota bacterium]
MAEPTDPQTSTCMPFMDKGGAETYRRKRYRLGPQRLLSRGEERIVGEAIAWLVSEKRVPVAPMLLDVPCGYGRLLAVARGRTPHAIGADLSLAQARLARHSAPATVGDLMTGLPFADETFDVVLCARLLHHIQDVEGRDRIFRELARVTRGYVLLSYYHPLLLWRWQRRLVNLRARAWGKSRALEAVRRALNARGSPKHLVALVEHDELVARTAAVGLALEREWTVVPGLHPHRFAALRKSRA